MSHCLNLLLTEIGGRCYHPRDMRKKNLYLVWLNWPVRCFCAGAGDIAHLKSLVPKGGRVVRVASERSFLRELPEATHAIVWNFKKEWFAIASSQSASAMATRSCWRRASAAAMP